MRLCLTLVLSAFCLLSAQAYDDVNPFNGNITYSSNSTEANGLDWFMWTNETDHSSFYITTDPSGWFAFDFRGSGISLYTATSSITPSAVECSGSEPVVYCRDFPCSGCADCVSTCAFYTGYNNTSTASALVTLDGNVTTYTSSCSTDICFNVSLFSTQGLDPNKTHSLKVSNAGGALIFYSMNLNGTDILPFTTSTQSTTSTQKTKIGAIVGAVVGGIFAVLVAISIVLGVDDSRKRRWRLGEEERLQLEEEKRSGFEEEERRGIEEEESHRLEEEERRGFEEEEKRRLEEEEKRRLEEEERRRLEEEERRRLEEEERRRLEEEERRRLEEEERRRSEEEERRRLEEEERCRLEEEERRRLEEEERRRLEEEDPQRRWERDPWNAYQRQWDHINSSSGPLKFEDIPWPLTLHPLAAHLDDIKEDSVTSFFHSQQQQPSRRESISNELIRWHRDRPETRAVINRVVEAERRMVEEGFNAVVRILAELRNNVT